MTRWQFWIDRGGTFTDVVARKPDKTLQTHKLLSVAPDRYHDAAIQGIRDVLGISADTPLPVDNIECVKMGTTVATNALLELQGEQTVLIITRGFKDALRIGNQARPRLFELDIKLPSMLYNTVIEVDERILADGTIETPLNECKARKDLDTAHASGCRAAAIALVHGYRYSIHEARLAELARDAGFPQISISFDVSPLPRIVPRAATTVVDAYTSPVLARYVNRVSKALPGVRLLFMQSSGGLSDAISFRGKDALLSGPAGGVVGVARTAALANCDRVIGFDMGGTSTDVSHVANGLLERTTEALVAGSRVRAPSIDVHTVAAGGGSLLLFDGARMRVGPASAGAYPGPACYGRNGPLALTDCNALLGKLRSDCFPSVFGPDGRGALQVGAPLRARFDALARQIAEGTGVARSPEQIAEGFLEIAVDSMANAIKKISVQRGRDVDGYTLACFGGAGGQHACLVADRLGIRRVLVHPHAGVLSALGIGLADVTHVADRAVETVLSTDALVQLDKDWEQLTATGKAKIEAQGVSDDRIEFVRRLYLRYSGSDTALSVVSGDVVEVTERFESQHQLRFGFISEEKKIIMESMQVETIGRSPDVEFSQGVGSETDSAPRTFVTTMAGRKWDTPFINRSAMRPGPPVFGPAVLLEQTGTTVVEPGWRATMSEIGDLILERVESMGDRAEIGTSVDPVQLEIFNNLFMNVAEQMGVVLQNTAASVNIKERLDFSCALFNPDGDLIANAPHIPVHLGSMGQSVKYIISANAGSITPGKVWVTNAPYNGGTHLPDITVVKPVYDSDHTSEPIFFVACRGHHADVGGKVPGSLPADSTTVDEEGVLLGNVLIVDNGRFLHDHIMRILTPSTNGARNAAQNIADLQAQIAACEKGARELRSVVNHYSLPVVHAYMFHVQHNAEEAVRRVLDDVHDGSFRCEMDGGLAVQIALRVDRASRSAVVDFTGTTAQHRGNLNAPSAIAHAAVLYVFRCLVDDDIPLNAGCLKPLTIVLPPSSLVNPSYPAAVVAGNVETSQAIVDALFGVLGAGAAAQGTMNNVTWGNDKHQYYETICGGAGATPNADGCSAVHTHMTNSRLTDPEVLESRFPVILETFHIRTGSGGSGKYKGGNGVVRRVRFNDRMLVNVLAGRRAVPPYGAGGGQPGSVGHTRKIGCDGAVTEFGASAQFSVGPGDRLEIETPGGGGYGVAA